MARFVIASLLLSGASASDESVLLQTKAESEQAPIARVFGFEREAPKGYMAPGGRGRIQTPRWAGKCGFGTEHPISEDTPPRPTRFLNCSQPMPAHVVDIRGEWVGFQANANGMVATSGGEGSQFAIGHHSERIEQCGDRVVISTEKGVLDYMHANGVFSWGVSDFDMWTLPTCRHFQASGEFDGHGCFISREGGQYQKYVTKPEKRCISSDGSTLHLLRSDGQKVTMHRGLKHVAGGATHNNGGSNYVVQGSSEGERGAYPFGGSSPHQGGGRAPGKGVESQPKEDWGLNDAESSNNKPYGVQSPGFVRGGVVQPRH